MSGANTEHPHTKDGATSPAESGPDDIAAESAADPAAGAGGSPAPGATNGSAHDAAAPGAGNDGSDGSDGSDDTGRGEAAPVDTAVDGSPLDEQSSELSVEGLVTDLERVTAERDQYLETSRRIQAEFENYRKQVTKRETEARERANEGLIGEMLPVLDAFDGALSSGVEDVVPMRTTLLETLAKQGLERIDPVESAFDPNLHEAVMHEEGEGGEAGPVVAEVMRAGYSWKGRVIRPAMVRVRG